MGNDEDIEKLKSEMEQMRSNQSFIKKVKDIQPILCVLILFFGGVTAWANLNSTARDNMQEIEKLDEDVEKAEEYASSKFNELKIILDGYKEKTDSTHDQVLQLTEQSKHQSEQINKQNELLLQLINKK